MSTTKSTCKNVLLIDNTVPEAQLFFNAVNADTFPILYSYNTTRAELLAILEQNFITIDRLGLVFTTEGSGRPKPFLEQAPFFTAAETATATSSPYSANVEFIISILRQFQIKNIDYLACATLTYPEWNNYYAILSRETTAIVGASNDNTGNIQYGGDWIMESTSEDIELIYFTESIEYYTHLLDATGEFTILMKGTTIYGTGINTYGGLGLNNTTNQQIITLMVDPSGGAAGTYYGYTPKYIACGEFSTIVLMTNGLIYGTGYTVNGELGLNNPATPVQILSRMVDPSNGTLGTYYGYTPKYIAMGNNHTLVLMTNGVLCATGNNSDGRLGLNNLTSTQVLKQMFDPSNGAVGTYYGKTPKYIQGGDSHTIVLMTDGTLYGTGSNATGQLGINNTTNQQILTPMVDPNSGAAGTYYGNTPKYIACGRSHTMVLMTNGLIYGTGRNTEGQLGINNTTTPQTTLTLMVDPSNGAIGTYYGKTPNYIACGIYYTIVLMTDGTIYGTGQNNSGQLGLNFNNLTSTQVLKQMLDPSNGAVGTYYGKTPSSIACGRFHTMVLMTDGTVYGTGRNNSGQLGINNITSPNYTLTAMVDAAGGNTYLMNYYDPVDPSGVPCFLKGTNILTNIGYRPIEVLRKGNLIKTLLHGYKPIEMIGYSIIYHQGARDRRKDQLYVCTPAQYPEVVEDVVLTGSHAILVDEFTDDQQRNETKEVLTDIFLTDNYYRLPACVDARTRVYDQPGTYTIYHLALQHENYYMNYGIYANGLLVESCSRRYMKECSGMRFVE